MSSQKHVYIPIRRTKTQQHNGDLKRPLRNKQPRFHGAFKGGFSAGHFNTVGSKEGWMPSQTKKRDQTLEDFMDDEDHAEWGGPQGLQVDYGAKDATKGDSKATGDTFLPLNSMLEISHETVGPRLLRRLGWRDGGTAIVPDQRRNSTDGTHDDLSKMYLSRRRLRKIKLQSTKMANLPPAKLDRCGLGFEPYKNAPEFQKYRDQRMQQAKDRATYVYRDNQAVYKVSDVVGDKKNRDIPKHAPEANSDYLSYETAEHFVGKRSAAGFALRDDEDDAYDETTYNKESSKTTKSGIHLGDEYNTEVYEHQDSSDDDLKQQKYPGRMEKQKPLNKKDASSTGVGNVFAAWAGANATSEKGEPSNSTVGRTTTSDGRLPMNGFSLAISTETLQKRYAGPEIPREYTIQRHQFGEHENPYVLEAISNAVRLEKKEEQSSRVQKEQQIPNPHSLSNERNRPLSKNFASLADAMKSRFTSSTSTVEGSSNDQNDSTKNTSFPAGLHLPTPVTNRTAAPSPQKKLHPSNVTPPKVSIHRTVQTFLPNPLVCKRFRVPVPHGSKAHATGWKSTNTTRSNTEEVYFTNEILIKAREQQNQQKEGDDEKQPKTNGTPSTKNEMKEDDKKPNGIVRPSIEKLRSIFEAPSDDSSSSEDYDSDHETEGNNDNLESESKGAVEVREKSPELKVESDEKTTSPPLSLSDKDASDSTHHRKRKRHRRKHDRHHRRYRKRRERKRSRSDTGKFDSDIDSISDGDESSSRRKEKRRRKEKKKKKKKHDSSSSSRHRSRKREKGDD